MINLKELPREPHEAFEKLVSHLIKASRAVIKIDVLREQGDPRYMELLVLSSAARKSVERFHDPELKAHILDLLTLDLNINAAAYGQKVENALNFFYISKLDDHFIDSGDVSSFEQVVLEVSEKDEIRDLMVKARECISRADELGQWRRGRINHWITKIENELLKDVSNWGTLIAGAYEVISLAKAGGKALAPAAEAVEKMRTITHKKLEGQVQLEADEKPKQIEDQSSD